MFREKLYFDQVIFFYYFYILDNYNILENTFYLQWGETNSMLFLVCLCQYVSVFVQALIGVISMFLFFYLTY